MMKWTKIAFAVTLALSFLMGTSTAAQPNPDVNDFRFSSFEADYYLSKDGEDRSRLKVVEKFTAEFPAFDQNKGVVRAIPLTYDGHPVSVNVESLTRNGNKEPIYDQQKSNDNLLVSTGTDEYVHGPQTYQLTYTLRDVVKDFGSHQEFYWDTNGTQSTQEFGTVTARVHLDKSTQGLFTGKITCYEGVQGSSKKCGSASVSANGAMVTFDSTGQLGPHENLTMVMEFKQDAFQPYSEGPAAVWRAALAILGVLLSVASVAWMIIIRVARGKSASGRGTIIAEYLPPKNISVLFASQLTKGGATNMLPAQLIDLAVRHNLRIIESEKERVFGTKKEYSLELLNAKGVNDDERQILEIFFPGLAPGTKYEMKTTSTKTGRKLRMLLAKMTKRVLDDGYKRKVNGIYWPLLPAFLGAAAGVGVLIWQIMINTFEWTIVAFAAGALGLTVTLIIAAITRPYTEKGAELRDYLKGLELYIKLAEADRLKVLQSPEGAEKTLVDTSDTAQVVKLYERVLPYAVLFGQEKEWAKQLGVYYENQQSRPTWYSGSSAFNPVLFSSAIAGFSSFTSNTNSSGSGFSGGGGYSGGGGGGGGFGGR